MLELLLSNPEAVEQVQLEVKTSDSSTLTRLCEKLTAMLAKLPDELRTKCVVTSFNPLVPQLVQRTGVAGLRQGLAVESESLLRSLLTVPALPYDVIALNHQLVTPAVVEQLNRKAIEVSCWTVNASHDWLHVREAGVASIITDYPTRMQQILQGVF